MSADGSAVVSGVDLALVSWVDGPVVDLSSVASQPRPHHHQRIGRCLCAKESTHPPEADGQPDSLDPAPPQLKSTLKKPRTTTTTNEGTSATTTVKNVDVQHIVPQVVQVVTSQRTRQHLGEPGMPADSKTLIDTTGRGRINRANTTLVASATTSVLPVKPILSRKNWNNTIDSSPQQHQPSCLRRYGSQQSCKSATTLRSYVSNTSRGNFQVNESTISASAAPHDKNKIYISIKTSRADRDLCRPLSSPPPNDR